MTIVGFAHTSDDMAQSALSMIGGKHRVQIVFPDRRSRLSGSRPCGRTAYIERSGEACHWTRPRPSGSHTGRARELWAG